MKRLTRVRKKAKITVRRARRAGADARTQVLIDRAHGAAFLSLARIEVRSGRSTPPATLHRQEQVWAIVQGVGCFHRRDQDGEHAVTTSLRPGDAVFIPPGYAHWVENFGDDDLVFLCCTSPPGTELQRKNQTRIEGEHKMADRFEYKILVSDSDDETDEETLNGLGEQGWELINAVADVRAGEDEGDESEDQNVPVTVFYFKRRKE